MPTFHGFGKMTIVDCEMLDHGSVQADDGTTVTLTQAAYPDADRYNTSRAVYRAAGRDAAGNVYAVQWTVTNPDAEEADNACDWRKPESVVLVERA